MNSNRVPKGVPSGGQFTTSTLTEPDVALSPTQQPPLAHEPFRFVTPASAIDEVEIVVPAGTYALGDPCYCFDDPRWDALLETNGIFGHDPGDGSGPVGWTRGFANPNESYEVIGLDTAYGDGSYQGSDGLDYPVDAGMIGLVPIGACNPDDLAAQTQIPNNSLTVVTFEKPTTVTRTSDGTLTFGNITIATGDQSEEEDDGYCETCGVRPREWGSDECESCGAKTCSLCQTDEADYDGEICTGCAEESGE